MNLINFFHKFNLVIKNTKFVVGTRFSVDELFPLVNLFNKSKYVRLWFKKYNSNICSCSANCFLLTYPWNFTNCRYRVEYMLLICMLCCKYILLIIFTSKGHSTFCKIRFRKPKLKFCRLLHRIWIQYDNHINSKITGLLKKNHIFIQYFHKKMITLGF